MAKLTIAEQLLFRKQKYTGMKEVENIPTATKEPKVIEETIESIKELGEGKRIDPLHPLLIPVPHIVFHVQDEKFTPFKKHYEDAGWDLRAAVEETVTIEPGKSMLIPTGVKCEIPNGYVGMVNERSGIGKKRVALRGRVVDSLYRGELKVIVHNLSDEPFRIERGDRIAQFVVHSCLLDAVVKFNEQISETARGEDGFGKSGVK